MNMEYNETKQKQKKSCSLMEKYFSINHSFFFNSLKHYKVIMTSNTPLKAI